MQEIFKDIQNLEQISVQNCVGWTKCGKKKKYKDYSIWELPKNTILFKGVSLRTKQSYNYIQDPDYIPNTDDKTDNFIYLTDSPENAAIYAKFDDSRIITVQTKAKIRLFDMNDPATLQKIFAKCSIECQNMLKHGFSLNNDYKSSGRNSSYAQDYFLVNLLMTTFPFIDGYAFMSTGKFHDEIVIFNPSNILRRYSLEYRPTGVQLNEKSPESHYPIEIWLEINGGKYVRPVILNYVDRQITNRFKYHKQEWDNRDDFIVENGINGEELIKIFKDSALFKEYIELYSENLINKAFRKFIYPSNTLNLDT